MKRTKSTTENTPSIQYISFGNGEKTMVVVPGLNIGYVTANEDALKDAFSAFTKEYTVYVFDIRDNVPKDYTLEQMSEDLASMIQRLGLKDIYLYGCSMGGMQSLYIAENYPELVAKMVIGSSAIHFNDNSRQALSQWLGYAKEGKCRELTANMGQRIYSQAVYEMNKEVFEAMADGMTEDILTRFIHTAAAIQNFDLTKNAAAIQCPILVMGAKGDQVLTGDASVEISELTGAELYMYGEEFPHAVYDEAPDFRDRVKAFFDKEI